MTFDAADLHGGAALVAAIARLRDAVQPRSEVGGWATVELDRTEASFGAASGPSGSVAFPATGAAPGGARDDLGDDLGDELRDELRDAHDELLGALARVIRTTDQRYVVLLEPFTEGRLAAALARHGEGFVALYLMANSEALVRARAAGFVLSSVGLGPFGPQRLVVEGPRWGPFLVLAGLD